MNRATSRYSIVLPTLGSLNDRELFGAPPSEREAQATALATLGELRGRNYDRLSMKSVAADSPLKAREAVEQIGIFFQREGSFDTQPYRADRVPDKTVAYLIFSASPERRGTIVGAICFGWYRWKSSPASYCLEWVWIHPYERRKGLLAAKWPYFRVRFGDFAVSKPRTPAMQRFLEKIEPELFAPLPMPLPVVTTVESVGEVRHADRVQPQEAGERPKQQSRPRRRTHRAELELAGQIVLSLTFFSDDMKGDDNE